MSNASQKLKVGGSNRFGEILIFNNSLNDDREKIEGTSHKWGMNTELLFSHSYFSTPPSGSSTLKANEIDPNWHHLAVTCDETPKDS